MLRAVRPAGVRVAEAQRAQYLAVADDRDDQRRGRRQFLLKPGGGAAMRAVVVAVDLAAERRLFRAHDKGDGARKIVATNAVGADEGAHVAGEQPRAVGGRDAAKRAGGGGADVNKAEISEARERSPGRALERTPMCC